MGVKGVTILADTLKLNNTLTSLNVEGNSIKDEGFTRLAQVLQQNNSIIEYLTISFRF